MHKKIGDLYEEVTTQVIAGRVNLSCIRRLAEEIYALGRTACFEVGKDLVVEVCTSLNKNGEEEVNFFLYNKRFGVKVNVLKYLAKDCPYDTWPDVVAEEVVERIGDAEKYFF